MSEETRQRILEVGARLIHLQGYNNTGIKQILDECGIPKGSFYFYFKSKEDFGVAVVDYFEAMLRQRVGNDLLDGDGGPLERLRNFFKQSRDSFAQAGYTLGCPIGNLAQELGDISPVLRQRLQQSLAKLTRIMARVLAEAKGVGELSERLDPEETAMFVVQAWHGALLRMKTDKSGTPLEVCETMLFDHLLRA